MKSIGFCWAMKTVDVMGPGELRLALWTRLTCPYYDRSWGLVRRWPRLLAAGGAGGDASTGWLAPATPSVESPPLSIDQEAAERENGRHWGSTAIGLWRIMSGMSLTSLTSLTWSYCAVGKAVVAIISSWLSIIIDCVVWWWLKDLISDAEMIWQPWGDRVAPGRPAVASNSFLSFFLSFFLPSIDWLIDFFFWIFAFPVVVRVRVDVMEFTWTGFTRIRLSWIQLVFSLIRICCIQIWTGLDWMKWIRLWFDWCQSDCFGLDQIPLDGILLDWTRLDWTGLDWI